MLVRTKSPGLRCLDRCHAASKTPRKIPCESSGMLLRPASVFVSSNSPSYKRSTISIRSGMNSLPTQSCNLSDPQRTDHHQRDDGFGRLRQIVDHTAYILLCEHNRRLPCLLAWQPDALRGIGANQFPRLSLVEHRSQTCMHIANRFRSQSRRKRVKEILKFDGSQLCEFLRTPFWQDVGVEMIVVADACRIFQQRPHLFPADCHQTCECFFPTRKELRLIVSLVDRLHEAVRQTLCFGSGGNQTLRPALRAAATLPEKVLPITDSPFGPAVLYSGPLVTFSHHDFLSVMLRP